ncbi:MAG: restriction endonuclease subunit S [Cyanobacteria bacterium]|nr:restriction endonuclease subunit S [Cyanobacteria bacterium CG_2015-16_32_12]NCO77467.1 restriction endonuclease subunit S [Cyanobacteria bacterium CG_2015-22_32_23]NCQ04060.1 restriction endonuclease subunit S [Cyanobacteria bacterium CG_2015-09_32_10]NCQ42415.1 restriction endonuclease subunit S [Cyanobacteria bacterium CG_2015-04_32_10]NCS84070.1 restriction endonuclease subunit S [Cyanobacteria bacterium CG_2015-02_32_10]
MSEWQKIKISQIADFNTESVNKNFNHNTIEYIDTSSVEEGRLVNTQKILLKEAPSRAKRRVKENDILISSVRPNLKHFYFVNHCKDNTIVSTGFVVITPKKGTDPKFLYYLLTTDSYTQYLTQIANSHTSTYPSFNPDVIANSVLSIPPLDEQKAIASVLSCLDAKIENLRKQNETLESIAQTLFKHWFIDFEFPNDDGKPYKSSGGEMRSTELGEIPKDWRVEGLDSIADFLNGLALQKYPPENENVFLPVIKIRELKSGITNNTDKANKDIPSQYIIDNGDVIFSWSGTLEVVIWCFGKGALNQHLFKVTSNKYPKWFYYQWTLHHLSNFQAIAKSKATTMGHIQRKHLTEALCCIPTDKQLRFFDGILTPILNKKIRNSLQIQTLTKTRDELLPKLMSGQIRVKE